MLHKGVPCIIIVNCQVLDSVTVCFVVSYCNRLLYCPIVIDCYFLSVGPLIEDILSNFVSYLA